MTKKEKAESITENVTSNLEYLIKNYIECISSDEEQNKTLLETVDKDWKQYAYRINRVQKVVNVSPFAFKEQLALTLKENLNQYKIQNDEKTGIAK